MYIVMYSLVRRSSAWRLVLEAVSDYFSFIYGIVVF